MFCLHSFLTLSPNPWVFEMAGVFTPGLLGDLSLSRGRGVGVLVAEDAEGRGVFGLSHGGCILLDARGPDKSTCLSSSGSRSLGAGERGTIVFR